MKQFEYKTAQGYKVLKVFSDGEQNYTVIARKDDFLVAWLYNPENGQWAQGHYGFETYADCIKWIWENSNISAYLKKHIKKGTEIFGKRWNNVLWLVKRCDYNDYAVMGLSASGWWTVYAGTIENCKRYMKSELYNKPFVEK